MLISVVGRAIVGYFLLLAALVPGSFELEEAAVHVSNDRSSKLLGQLVGHILRHVLPPILMLTY